MTNEKRTILIMAGGTGGHIFPALAIAEKLQEAGARVEWLGSTAGLEVELVGKTRIPLHLIAAQGLRGKGLRGALLAPLMLLHSTWQAIDVVGQLKPACVLGMGGFVTGPGAVAARLRGCPLVIHEQNAVPGITNRLLAPLAGKILQAFPGTFTAGSRVHTVGNPVRQSITALAGSGRKPVEGRPLQLLVLGGSQGAQAINELMPPLLARWGSESRPRIWHQTGNGKLTEALSHYGALGLATGESLRVCAFIDDMAAAYRWADLVICRAGASTVAEIAVAGLPALFIPYPHHKDQQQLKNASWLERAGAALIRQQAGLTADSLLEPLRSLDSDRQRLATMSAAAQGVAISDADARIASHCLEIANG
jgi:UDP-N-acetylglucosamine--N-acetylmuramyl-(pentapeptide) pyrophosphoryl-undecaprenol N-acetylglucosamine transferase